MGVSSFTVQATDSLGVTNRRALSIAVSLAPLAASCATIAQADSAYAGCTITGGIPAYTCPVTSGRLPTGVMMQSDCTTTGTATTAETVSFTVVITDSIGASITKSVTVGVTSR
jgi:hypothetical protein